MCGLISFDFAHKHMDWLRLYKQRAKRIEQDEEKQNDRLGSSRSSSSSMHPLSLRTEESDDESRDYDSEGDDVEEEFHEPNEEPKRMSAKERVEELDARARDNKRAMDDVSAENRIFGMRLHAITNLPHTKTIKLVPIGHRKKCWQVTEANKKSATYQGLTNRLNSCFFPTPEPEDKLDSGDDDDGDDDDSVINMLSARTMGHSVKRKQKCLEPDGTKGKKFKCKGFGMVHGRIVHKEVGDMLNLCNSGNTLKAYLKENVPDPCSLRLLSWFLITKGWCLLRAEYPVYDCDLRVASAVDFVFVDPANRKVIFVELKTGCSVDIFNPSEPPPNTPKLIGVLKDIDDTPYNRAAVQLATTTILMQSSIQYAIEMISRVNRRLSEIEVHTRDTVPMPDHSYIVHVSPSDTSIHMFELPPWAFDGRCRLALHRAMMPSRKRERDKPDPQKRKSTKRSKRE